MGAGVLHDRGAAREKSGEEKTHWFQLVKERCLLPGHDLLLYLDHCGGEKAAECAWVSLGYHNFWAVLIVFVFVNLIRYHHIIM